MNVIAGQAHSVTALPRETPDLVRSGPYTYGRGPHACQREGLNAPASPTYHGGRAPELPPTLSHSGDTRNSQKRGRPRSERDCFLDPSGPRGKGRPERANEQAPGGVTRPCGARVIPVTGSDDVDHTATAYERSLPLSARATSISRQLRPRTNRAAARWW